MSQRKRRQRDQRVKRELSNTPKVKDTETIGIACDNWKVPVFKKRLAAAGFQYRVKKDGPITAIVVVTDNRIKLASVVKAANDECDDMKN